MSTPTRPRTTRAEELKTAAMKKKREEAEGKLGQHAETQQEAGAAPVHFVLDVHEKINLKQHNSLMHV